MERCCVSAGRPGAAPEAATPTPAPFSPLLHASAGKSRPRQVRAPGQRGEADPVFGYGIRVPGFPGGALRVRTPTPEQGSRRLGPMPGPGERPGGGIRGISAPHSLAATPDRGVWCAATAAPPVGSRVNTMEGQRAGIVRRVGTRPRCDLGGGPTCSRGCEGAVQGGGRGRVDTLEARQSLRGCRGLRARFVRSRRRLLGRPGGQTRPSASQWPGDPVHPGRRPWPAPASSDARARFFAVLCRSQG